MPSTSAPQVPIRISVRAPSPISSSTTIAALGPPMPVDWTVSGDAVAGGAGVAPQPAVVVEHQRLLEQRLRDVERAVRVAGQQHALGEVRGRAQVDRGLGHRRHDMEHCALPMANRRTNPKELPDAVREAVERTVQATVGGAQSTRDRTRDTLDELVKARRGAGARGA